MSAARAAPPANAPARVSAKAQRAKSFAITGPPSPARSAERLWIAERHFAPSPRSGAARGLAIQANPPAWPPQRLLLPVKVLQLSKSCGVGRTELAEHRIDQQAPTRVSWVRLRLRRPLASFSGCALEKQRQFQCHLEAGKEAEEGCAFSPPQAKKGHPHPRTPLRPSPSRRRPASVYARPRRGRAAPPSPRRCPCTPPASRRSRPSPCGTRRPRWRRGGRRV